MHKIKLHQFEGPLDLLLSLIEDQKLDITQISLSQVAEQFLLYVKQLEQIDPTSLADYLSIAARLLVIKSKAILPSLEIEQEEEELVEDLTEKLLVYRQFKEVAKHLKKLDARQQQSFTRETIFSQRISFFPDPSVTPDLLRDSILKVVQGLKELDNLPKAKIREAISIQERIDSLQMMLSHQIETKLSDVLANAKNKPDVIITFLALLELIKQRIFIVDQEMLFSDITIKKYEKTEQEIEIINTANPPPTPDADDEDDLDDDEADEDDEDEEED